MSAVQSQVQSSSPGRHFYLVETPSHEAIRLQEIYNKGLTISGSRLKLTEEDRLSPKARKILSLFDEKNAQSICRALADGGVTSTQTVSLPIGFQRTILREALADLRILELINVFIDATSNVVNVPYEIREAGFIVNDGIVFEGHGIPRASLRQTFDTVWLLAIKLSLRITNEAIHFTASIPGWDALARNIESNARLVRELIARLILNELQRSSDAYQSVTISNENVAPQLTGNASLIKTAQWPIIRQKIHVDFNQNQTKPTENPIALVINGVTCLPYDGTGMQPAGTYYYVENPNLGFIRLVNKDGAPVKPTATSACTLSYSTTDNCKKFDLKLPAGKSAETHLNGLLQMIGASKAQMNAERYIRPDYLLMSPTLNDLLTNASAFVSAYARPGTALTMEGDLERIKGLPTFSSNVPGSDLGYERILLGSLDAATYVLSKPFTTGTPFEAINPTTGNPTGEKIAYGEEYSAIHVPMAYRSRLSSVLAYDSDARNAAV